MDTELANDRTFLAWLRTGIALFGLGFVVAKVALSCSLTKLALRTGVYSAVGVVFVQSGAALVVIGYLQHARVLRSLDRVKDALQPRWPFTITVIAVVGSLVLSALLIIST